MSAPESPHAGALARIPRWMDRAASIGYSAPHKRKT